MFDLHPLVRFEFVLLLYLRNRFFRDAVVESLINKSKHFFALNRRCACQDIQKCS